MPTAQPVFKFTYEDYRTAPPDRRCELVDGELVMVPAPNLKHQTVQVRLGERLARFVRENRLGMLFFAPCDVVLSNTDIVQPDLLFVSAARAQLLSGGENVRGAPTWWSKSCRRPPPRLQARAVCEARRGRVLAGRSCGRNGADSPPAQPRTRARRDAAPGTDVAFAPAAGVRPESGRRLLVLTRPAGHPTRRRSRHANRPTALPPGEAARHPARTFTGSGRRPDTCPAKSLPAVTVHTPLPFARHAVDRLPCSLS